MDKNEAKQFIELLRSKNIDFEIGLTDNELLQVENTFNIFFPPDLKIFLETELPIGDRFPNWRKAISDKQEYDKIIDKLTQPLHGILFDIEHNNFWFEEWGQEPTELNLQIEKAKVLFKIYPKLIPIFGHRFISSLPFEKDNPIYSVHQTDITYYGYNLAAYLSNEFHFKLPENIKAMDKHKNNNDFWTWCVENNWKQKLYCQQKAWL